MDILCVERTVKVTDSKWRLAAIVESTASATIWVQAAGPEMERRAYEMAPATMARKGYTNPTKDVE